MSPSSLYRIRRPMCAYAGVSIAFLLLLTAGGQPLWCQAPGGVEMAVVSPLADDIDAMFEAPSSEEGKQDVSGDDVLSSIVDQKNVSFSGSFKAIAGYTGGVMNFTGPEAWDSLVNAAVYSMSSALCLDARLDRTFQVFGKLKIDYPELEARVDELFCDYIFLESMFLRAGRQTITWGASHFFPYTNLPARLPDGFLGDGNNDDIDDEDSIALKMTVPFGLSGLTALVLARNGYFEDAEKPGFRELGYGGLLDLSFAGGEIVVGGFYQQELRSRGYISTKTTLWGIDLYAEVLGSASLEFASGGGLFWEGFGSRLIVMTEYLYNGETSDLKTAGSSLSLPQGHTYALRLGLRDFPFPKSKTGVEWKHNFSDRSGTVIPGITVDAFPHLALSLAVPLVYGPDTGYFVVENPDLRDRGLALVLLATLSGSF